jgi:putative transposase
VDWRVRLMRRPALNIPGDAHALTFTCYRRFQFLRSECICQWLADSLNKARTKLDFRIWAYVFMPEHVHLLIWPAQPVYDIRVILQAVKQPVGRKAMAHIARCAPQWLPRVTVHRNGRMRRLFWQLGGGFDSNENEPRAVLEIIDYFHCNPVRRQLVTKPEEWRWSSAGWFEGKNSLRPDPIDLGGMTVYSRGHG